MPRRSLSRSTSPSPATASGDPRRAWWDLVDLVAVIALVPLAMVAALTLQGGGIARVLLVAPVVLVAPGYLLIQAAVGRTPSWRRRGMHAVFALGVTPALIGLIGIGTTMLPGGYVAINIIVTISVFCLVAAGVAGTRRVRGSATAASEPEPEAQPSAGAEAQM